MSRHSYVDPPAVGGAEAKPEGSTRRRSLWRGVPILVVVALGLAFLMKTFLVQAFYIPSSSMETPFK